MLVIKIFSERKNVFREGKKCEKIRTKSRDERRTTQNSGICSPGEDGEMYYEDDPDIIHVDNSSDLALSTSLSDLEITALHIDGQSIDVDAPPDIIDDAAADDDDDDEDDDIIDDDDVLPHDLVDFDDEDLVNVDDDDGMSADLARGHDGKGTRKPNLGGRKAGKMHTRKETRNLSIPAERKMQSSTTQEYPFLIQTFFDTNTIGDVFMWDEDRRLYEEMQRLHALGKYTYDQIMIMVRKGMQRWHIPSVGQGLARRGKDVLDVPHETGSGSGSGSESDVGGDNKSRDDKDADKDEEDVDS
uniref:Uncharacterized protein n=1 Tax=Tanacetum cinerariifolium TaxID=118510 RepID=A0A6L2JIX4_TANCI|nr:hypothetical protein [Tanacetum cinerariifolium]